MLFKRKTEQQPNCNIVALNLLNLSIVIRKTINMKKIAFPLLLLIVASYVFTGCDKDDPEIPNEEELITTVIYNLNTAGGDLVTLSWKDLDGDAGGEEPTITAGTLNANETYTGILVLLNESVSPPVDVGMEVLEEGEEHQLFFEPSSANVSVNYDDEDGNGNPLGLKTVLTTGDVGSGTITITLRHEPVKTASGVSDGDITNAQGATDVKVTIPFDVQ